MKLAPKQNSLNVIIGLVGHQASDLRDDELGGHPHEHLPGGLVLGPPILPLRGRVLQVRELPEDKVGALSWESPYSSQV